MPSMKTPANPEWLADVSIKIGGPTPRHCGNWARRIRNTCRSIELHGDQLIKLDRQLIAEAPSPQLRIHHSEPLNGWN